MQIIEIILYTAFVIFGILLSEIEDKPESEKNIGIKIIETLQMLFFFTVTINMFVSVFTKNILIHEINTLTFNMLIAYAVGFMVYETFYCLKIKKQAK